MGMTFTVSDRRILTLIKNFPMAFFWNMFAAAPFTNWACGKLFE